MAKHFYLIPVVFLIISSCGDEAHKESVQGTLAGDTEDNIQPTNDENLPKKAAFSPIDSHKLIKTVRLNLKVASVEGDMEYLAGQAAELGGYVGDYDQKINQWVVGSKKISSDSLEQTIGQRTEATVVIKIPAANLEQLLEQIESKALAVEHKIREVQDVTKKVIDLETRMSTKLRIEKKYLDILESKAGKLEEVLEVEAKIDQIREEIEVMQTRLKHLNQRVAFSTIHLSLYQEPTYRTLYTAVEKVNNYEEGFGLKAKNAFLSGWKLLKDLVIALFYLWPLIVTTIIVYSYIRLRKRVKSKTVSQ